MRVGVVGLAALYWPIAMGNGLQDREGVHFLSAATLDVDDTLIQATLGMTAAAYAERYQINLYSDAAEMIAREALDTVVLISRHSEHADWVEQLAPLGVNLFIPKTFTTTLADAERIVQVQERTGVKIAVGPSARFLPAMVAAKQALDEGLIGQPFALRICHHHGTIDVFNGADWYREPGEGGPELSLGWYGIDLALHLMGDRVQTVAAQYGNFTSPDSPFMDCGRIEMRMARGGMASFDMYFCNRVAYPAWQVEIVGPQGVISVHRVEGDSRKTVVSLDNAQGYTTLPLPAQTPHWETFWVDEFLHDRPLTLSAATAQEITVIALAARESAQQGQVIAL
ncbi:MAG: Gfo/Idh/MocA family oxidoreductase [Caldilineaceae bacterium]